MDKGGVRSEFRALDYFLQQLDRITSQVAKTPSERDAIEAAAEEVVHIIAHEVQRLAAVKRAH